MRCSEGSWLLVLVRNRVRHLLVTDKEAMKALGIVTSTDIVAYVKENSGVTMQLDKDVRHRKKKEDFFLDIH
jgi:signal-transduction protein with cAMP-binding, CBS, and nucleotidyltransferase domain